MLLGSDLRPLPKRLRPGRSRIPAMGRGAAAGAATRYVWVPLGAAALSTNAFILVWQ